MRLRDHLVVAVELRHVGEQGVDRGAHDQAAPFLVPFQLGFSQMTVPPMPDPPHGGQAVADRRILFELPGQLNHQPHTGRRERMPEGDGAAVRVDAVVVLVDAVVIEERQHLHGSSLVDLEGVDVVDGQAGLGQRLVGRRDGTTAITSGRRRRRRK